MGENVEHRIYGTAVEITSITSNFESLKYEYNWVIDFYMNIRLYILLRFVLIKLSNHSLTVYLVSIYVLYNKTFVTSLSYTLSSQNTIFQTGMLDFDQPVRLYA